MMAARFHPIRCGQSSPRSVLLDSMQVRDSKVSFTPDAALGMLVHLHNGKKGGSDESKERVQSMQSYGMDDWKDWKGFISPGDCLMKHRTSDMYASKHCKLVDIVHDPASNTAKIMVPQLVRALLLFLLRNKADSQV